MYLSLLTYIYIEYSHNIHAKNPCKIHKKFLKHSIWHSFQYVIFLSSNHKWKLPYENLKAWGQLSANSTKQNKIKQLLTIFVNSLVKHIIISLNINKTCLHRNNEQVPVFLYKAKCKHGLGKKHVICRIQKTARTWRSRKVENFSLH